MSLILKKIVRNFNPKINKKTAVRLATGIVALSNFFALTGCNQVERGVVPSNNISSLINTSQTPEETAISSIESANLKSYATTGNYSDLQFKTIKFAGKYYLTIDKVDLLSLIQKAINDCEKEYVNNGATPCFSVDSNKFSEINENLIYALFEVETSLRLIELIDVNDETVDKNIYNVENYKRFYAEIDRLSNNNGESKTIYYGLGMMDETSIKDYIDRDRKTINKFNNPNLIKIDNKDIIISFNNINPYDYLMNSNPKTEKEIKTALAENIQLTVRCCLSMLHRSIKDGVKKGKHDRELQILNSCDELNKYNQEEKQIWFALLCYNEGYNKVYNALINEKLFEKNSVGEYSLNVKYCEKVFELYYQLVYEFDTVDENSNQEMIK